ncbi:MAG: hypothetical protein GY711_18660 [bacterium]|nr:hypothetical protein [bacterium]
MLLRTALLALPLLFAPDAGVDEARRRAESKDYAGAVELLTEHLKRSTDDVEALELIGRCLLELGRRDESAHYLDDARLVLLRSGRGKEASRIEKLLGQADGLAKKRARLFQSLTDDLLDAGEDLYKNGQAERAAELFERILPVADPSQRKKLEAWIERVGAAAAEVDLDAAAGEKEEGEAPNALVEHESEHYKLVCNLEPDVVSLVADTMDDIYAYYVQVYFDGQEKRAPKVKATIRVHPTWEAMSALWPAGDPSPGLGGWWSPGSSEVHCFDTRERNGSLDEMLDTLFHEASHQFMTALARGMNVPTWLNEGTSCFFEGAVAMSDHRVLWPDAALDRLSSLSRMIESKSGPGVETVLAYAGPGSYPGEYYAWGWGLVYFLQQWEHPETFEYSYRPLYAEYRAEILRGRMSSLELFEATFLGRSSPLGHETLDDFTRDWTQWILETVKPTHIGSKPERRARRMDLVDAYRARADEAKERGKRATISEEEYVLRALGHIEYVRTKLGDLARPEKDVLLVQADLLERLDRKKSAAALLEQLLDLADREVIALAEEESGALEKRLKRLDRGNYVLRNFRSKTRRNVTRAKTLLAEYRKKHPDKILRAYTLATQTTLALADTGELAEQALELRAAARDAGLLLGRVHALQGKRSAWDTPFSQGARSLRVKDGAVRASAVRPAALIDTSVTVEGEYEIRAKLNRIGERHLGTAHGFVIGGTPTGSWQILGFNDEGYMALWTVQQKNGGARLRPARVLNDHPPLAPGAAPEISIRVSPDGALSIRIGDAEPVDARIVVDLPGARHVGLFVRDGELELEHFVVEVFP